MYRYIFNRVKKIIPRISDTELIALRSGTTSLDREIYKGSVNINNMPNFTEKEDKLKSLMPSVNSLLSIYGEEPVYPNPKIDDILTDISKSKLFSLIIPPEYGGHKLSTVDLSRLLVYITSANPSIGVTVMVPNSLGPGELLETYGNEKQKEQYLPGLSDGSYIPCFGLTGPNNGSDATGSIDTGVVKMNSTGKRYIDLTINKRYITMAPIANLVGIAFRLEDPNNLLQYGKTGVTVALIEGDHPGLKKETHHNPMNVGFPNGTLKGNIHVDLESIIGGEKNAGQGWKMLMECLAAGRAVSLPATALAGSKVATYGIYNYAKHRTQFKIPLLEMDAISNKLADMIFNTWLIECSTSLTNHLLDRGDRPAVISAVMKQQTTDRAREVINHGMDIHGGSGICLGYGNFLEKFYRSAPVSITVEGSNTLTRNLIIFGQGLNKSHPHIFDILESILSNDFHKFKGSFKKQIRYLLALYMKSFLPLSSNRLSRQTRDFALLSNFVALQGGKIKSNQALSADMADIFSNLYLAHSVEWYENQRNISKPLKKYCIDRLLDENDSIINRVIYNNKYFVLWHLRTRSWDTNYSDRRELMKEVKNNKKIMETIKNDIYTNDNILKDYELLEKCEKDTNEYKELVNKIIQVGEHSNITNKPKPNPCLLAV